MNPEKVKELTEAILAEAGKYGGAGMSITFLIKFIYLADCYNAEVKNGETITGAAWEFLHFGPYSSDLAALIESFESSGLLERYTVESGGDREFDLIKLRPMVRATPVDKLEAPFHVRSSLVNIIKKYRFDLQGLLNLVYFRTEPMQAVRPRDKLSFEKCYRLRTEDVKPIYGKEMSAADKGRLKDLFNKIRENYIAETHRYELINAIYDDVYFEAANAVEIDINENADVTLHFPEDG